MNWLILYSDVAFTLVATILCTLGLSTLKATKDLGTGRSFWIPVFVSGALFLIGSVVRIFHDVAVELGLPILVAVELGSLTVNTEAIVNVSWLLALCTLIFSIYNYSRKVKSIRSVTISDAPKELTPIEEQTAELLKRIEKLKKQIKG